MPPIRPLEYGRELATPDRNQIVLHSAERVTLAQLRRGPVGRCCASGLASPSPYMDGLLRNATAAASLVVMVSYVRHTNGYRFPAPLHWGMAPVSVNMHAGDEDPPSALDAHR